MEDKRIWLGILFVGIFFHIASAAVMPLGLDAHIHLNYVTDDLADGDASLDWGEVRTEGSDYSIPEEVKADDRWQVWHAIIGLWIAIFGSTLASLHVLSLAISIGCLATVYWCTSKISSQENAIALTAICSIYSPLVRASGRLYQENIVLLLATLAVFGLLQIYQKRRPTLWAGFTFLSVMAILSLKGLNPAYAIVIFSPAAYIAIKQIEMKPLTLPIVFISCTILAFLATVLRGEEVSLDTAYFIIRTLFVGGFIYVFVATLFFSSQSDNRTEESNLLLLLSQVGFIGLVAYIVMLLEVEKSSLGISASLTADQFSYIFRYMTVLIVPLWWSFLTRSETEKISFKENPSRNAMIFAIILILFLNSTMLNTTKGMEYIGEEISDEVEVGDNILYVSEPYHAMHRLYTLQITVDPEHDREITGYWADYQYNWSHLLDDSEIDWVIFTGDWQSYLDDTWAEFETDTDYLIYHRKTAP
jgi:hypothetical protein